MATATIFPQDAWGSPSTFPGEMHKILSGFFGLLSILSKLLIDIWSNQVEIIQGFGTYFFIVAGEIVLSVGFFSTNLRSPIMVHNERITILAGFLWTFILAW